MLGNAMGMISAACFVVTECYFTDWCVLDEVSTHLGSKLTRILRCFVKTLYKVACRAATKSDPLTALFV